MRSLATLLKNALQIARQHKRVTIVDETNFDWVNFGSVKEDEEDFTGNRTNSTQPALCVAISLRPRLVRASILDSFPHFDLIKADKDD